MEISNLEEVKLNYEDLRFGMVDIYLDPERELMIMKKTTKANSNEEFELYIKQAEERAKIDQDNLLKMLCVEADPDEKEICSYFEYPSEDIYEHKDKFINKTHLKKFLVDIIQALVFLEQNKMIHGNIRPEYLFFDEESNTSVLLDRLGDVSAPNTCQINNLNQGDKLFMSPRIFNNILKRNLTSIDHHPFKSEVFSLGMVVLSLLSEVSEEDKVQKVYDKNKKVFDETEFKNILETFKNKHDGSNEGKFLNEFVANHMLSLDENQNLKPKNLHKVLVGGVPLKDIQQKNFVYQTPSTINMNNINPNLPNNNQIKPTPYIPPNNNQIKPTPYIPPNNNQIKPTPYIPPNNNQIKPTPYIPPNNNQIKPTPYIPPNNNQIKPTPYIPPNNNQIKPTPYIPPNNNQIKPTPYIPPNNNQIKPTPYIPPNNNQIKPTPYIPPNNNQIKPTPYKSNTKVISLEDYLQIVKNDQTTPKLIPDNSRYTNKNQLPGYSTNQRSYTPNIIPSQTNQTNLIQRKSLKDVNGYDSKYKPINTNTNDLKPNNQVLNSKHAQTITINNQVLYLVGEENGRPIYRYK
jgi:hypothetical protein